MAREDRLSLRVGGGKGRVELGDERLEKVAGRCDVLLRAAADEADPSRAASGPLPSAGASTCATSVAGEQRRVEPGYRLSE